SPPRRPRAIDRRTPSTPTARSSSAKSTAACVTSASASRRCASSTRNRPTATRFFFGAWFETRAAEGTAQRLRIVGPDETDAALGWISVDSPLARAALKKRIDDEFDAELPGGRRRFVVVAVSYDDEGTNGGG